MKKPKTHEFQPSSLSQRFCEICENIKCTSEHSGWGMLDAEGKSTTGDLAIHDFRPDDRKPDTCYWCARREVHPTHPSSGVMIEAERLAAMGLVGVPVGLILPEGAIPEGMTRITLEEAAAVLAAEDAKLAEEAAAVAAAQAPAPAPAAVRRGRPPAGAPAGRVGAPAGRVGAPAGRAPSQGGGRVLMQVWVTPELFDRVKAYRFTGHHESRTAAVVALIERGLGE